MNQHEESLLDHGVTCYRNGQFALAVDALKRGLEVDKSNWQMRFYLAMSYTRMDMPREAKQEFITIRDFCPDAELRKRATSAISALTVTS